MKAFNGKKYVYLSEISPLGGKSLDIGYYFLAVAAFLGGMMLTFVFLQVFKGRDSKLYSTENMQW